MITNHSNHSSTWHNHSSTVLAKKPVREINTMGFRKILLAIFFFFIKVQYQKSKQIFIKVIKNVQIMI